MDDTDILTFYHFNDVYHISDADLIAKFAHKLAQPKRDKNCIHPLTVFSGDVFSPSTESSILKGEHMVPLLNHLDIDVACYGNHDFDYGEQRLIELSKKTNFPWLLSNVLHNSHHSYSKDVMKGKLLALSKRYVVRSMGGYRIGFFGLAGTDWPSNCQHLPPAEFLSPVEVSRTLARHLRTVEECDFVIAVTHMRLIEDLAVSKATQCGDERVDLLLGGHDHNVVCRFAGDTDENPEVILEGMTNSDYVNAEGKTINVDGDVRIIKSGTDWRSYSVVKLAVKRNGDGRASVQTVKLTQYPNITLLESYKLNPASTEIPSILASVHERVMNAVRHPLLHTRTPLDGRSSIIRSRETNLGNMLADAVRAFYSTDIAFINSGGVRCDRIIGTTGENNALKAKDIIDIVPFDNAFVVKRIRGSILLTTLENSVSDAHTDGRFLQVSGLRVVASWRRKEGSRILEVYYKPVSGALQKIDPERSYTIAMVSFIASGFDGYYCFKDEETVVDTEGAMTDTSLVLQIFGYTLEEEDRSGTDSIYDKEDDGVDTNGGGGTPLLEEGENDKTERGIQRAREAIIVGVNDVDGLPIVSPGIDDRLKFVSEPSL
ncbi:hypothetical protein FQN54_005113 [Arachnomyces sp. PD_36]|nr:hypothetical protein FQN54_005113 [Arachnomyces sp. PD_36]